jgi:hypothetical protein
MSQELTDISLDTLLRTLELHYAQSAAGLFRANGFPEPRRLADSARPESPGKIDAASRPPDPVISQQSDIPAKEK